MIAQRESGFTDSYRSVKRFVRKLRSFERPRDFRMPLRLGASTRLRFLVLALIENPCFWYAALTLALLLDFPYSKPQRLHPGNRFGANSCPMELNTLKDLYVHELKDLFSAEQQLVRPCQKWRRRRPTRNSLQVFSSILNRPKNMLSGCSRSCQATSSPLADRSVREWKVSWPKELK